MPLSQVSFSHSRYALKLLIEPRPGYVLTLLPFKVPHLPCLAHAPLPPRNFTPNLPC